MTNAIYDSAFHFSAFTKEAFQELVRKGADPNARFAKSDSLSAYIYTRKAENIKIPEDLEFFVSLGVRVRPLTVAISIERFNDSDHIHSTLSYLIPLVDPLDIDSKDLFSTVIVFCHDKATLPDIMEFCLKRMEENSLCFSDKVIPAYPKILHSLPESEKPRYLSLCGDDLIRKVLADTRTQSPALSIPLYTFTHFVERDKPAADQGSKILRNCIEQGKLEQALVLSSRGYTIPDGLGYFKDKQESNCKRRLSDDLVLKIYYHHFNEHLNPKDYPDTASILALMKTLFEFDFDEFTDLHGEELRHFQTFLVQHYFPQYLLFLQVGIPLPREIILSEIMSKIITTDYQ